MTLNDNDITAGMDLVYEGPRGVFTCTVTKVEASTEFGAKTPLVVVYVDNGEETIATRGCHLNLPSKPGESEVFFIPAATMSRTDTGDWQLEVEFSNSLQGGSLWGVIVEDHPQGEQAADALDAWFKQRGRKLTFTIPAQSDPAPEPEAREFEVFLDHTQVERVRYRVEAADEKEAIEEARRQRQLGDGGESCEVLDDEPAWDHAVVQSGTVGGR